MSGDLHNIHSELEAVLRLQVVLQHDDLEVVGGGDTLGSGEDVTAADDDS